MFKTFFIIFLLSFSVFTPEPLLISATPSLQNPENIQKGVTLESVEITSARKYLKAFGYLEDYETNFNNTDTSNTHDLETSIKKSSRNITT